ncbi:DUF3325 domain-containing protein [Variovorax sp. PAMC 28711]|uniref:DUF3325 domain-containing protein n=1 Tax=Variovorax sp. PAMC 28711 TaxID=1795631 RepID=UPI00078D453A|nr:DUF3325 domain-containing protein [Variovorax sp. PAMC 28711]AMM24443.1 hypothetical protein AX767_08830 [Variovorax sp. PAMC 28711]
MTHLLTFVLCLSGFMALALATERQQEILFARVLEAPAARGWRVFGWSALTVALIVAVHHWGWAFGLVVYSGHTSVCAGLTYLALVRLGHNAASRR